MTMEAHGNEYVAQLLDRAANLITASAEEQDTDRTEHEQWLREYHQEKARFGQPEGSPAYADTRGTEDQGETDSDGNEPRTARSAAIENRGRRQAPRAKK